MDSGTLGYMHESARIAVATPSKTYSIGSAMRKTDATYGEVQASMKLANMGFVIDGKFPLAGSSVGMKGVSSVVDENSVVR